MAKLLTGTRVYGTANVDSVLRVGNTTPVNSTSNTTGSLIVTGGVGITGNVYTGNIVITGNTSNGITFADGTRQTTAASGIDQWVRDTANVAIGVDASQNVRLDFSNAAITIIQGVDVTQNTRLTVIEGTNASQNVRLDFSNTRMNIIDGVNASQNIRLDFSNTAITIIQGVDVGQNNRMAIIEGTDTSQNVRLDFSNTRMDISDGVNASQNVRLDYSNTAINATDGKMQSAYNQANTGTVLAQSTTSFSRILVSGQPDAIANIANTPVTFVAGSGILITSDGVSNTITFNSTGGFSGGTITNQLIIANNTTAISNVTGALQVQGGVGVTGNIYVGGTSDGVDGLYTDVLRYAANGLPWVMGSGGGGASPSGYLANTIIVANSTGYLSNSNAFFVASNNNVLFPNSIYLGGTLQFTTGGSLTSASLNQIGSVFATPNWSTAYNTSQYGGMMIGGKFYSFIGGGLFNNTTYLNEFGSPYINSIAVPTSGNIATLLIGAPQINDANTNLARVVPYSLWANGSIYTANNVTVANSVIVSGGVEIVTSVVANNVGTATRSVVVNDITNQFDNLKCVFNLVSEQSNVVNIMNSRNLEVIVNGAKLAPYVTELRYPWLTPYDSFKGHRVVSSNTSSQLVIYNPPAPGDQAILTLINSSSTSQNRRYPYSAATIALGD